MINKYNVYDYILFPNQKDRELIKKEYFDVNSFRYTLETYNKNHNLSNNIEIKGLENFLEIDEVVNNDFREFIRTINNQIFYTSVVLYRMCYYYKLKDKQNIKYDRDLFQITELMFRKEVVNASFEIYNIQEKMKTIIKKLYCFSSKNNGEFEKNLKILSKKDNLIYQFIKEYEQIKNNKYYKLIRKIRNDEVHNKPVIDEVSWTIKNDRNEKLYLMSPQYKIGNEKLYIGIKETLLKIFSLKQIIQQMIDKK